MFARRRWAEGALAAGLVCLTSAAQSQALPRTAPGVAILPGVFCAPPEGGRAPAPDTVSGWVHVPDQPIEFLFPGLTTAPAQLGLGFGVTFTAPDAGDAAVTYVIDHPPMPPTGQTRQSWTSALRAGSGSIFYQFDILDELLPGTWAFTALVGGTELFHVPFAIQPQTGTPDLTERCQPAPMLSLSPSAPAAAG